MHAIPPLLINVFLVVQQEPQVLLLDVHVLFQMNAILDTVLMIILVNHLA
jgi:hypothetical protein